MGKSDSAFNKLVVFFSLASSVDWSADWWVTALQQLGSDISSNDSQDLSWLCPA